MSLPRHLFSTGLSIAMAALSLHAEPAAPTGVMTSQWRGRRVAFLGDSITDKCHVGTTKNYWQYLGEELGLEPLVYGINGHDWRGVMGQAERLKAEQGDRVDAIFIFAGTNDFNGGCPLGTWWEMTQETINSHGQTLTKPRRRLSLDAQTFRGRINRVLSYLRQEFPSQQLVLMTPIHRGYANFGGANVQPEESFPNDAGIYLETYVGALREAADIWATELIDLYRISGLHPLTASHSVFFHDAKTDLPHPSAAGHFRIAQAMKHRMLAMPASFRQP